MNSQLEEVGLLKKQGKTYREIGSKLGFSERTAARRYSEYKKSQFNYLEDLDAFSFDRFKPLVRTGNVLITCDYHIPLYDVTMVNNLIRVAKENDIKQLVIAGDYLHLDTFSHFLPHQAEADFTIERREATRVMETLLQTFDEVDITWGNHEHRISKFLDFKLSFKYCMEWIMADLGSKLKQIRFSELDYMFYKTKDRTFRICHPNSFSKIPLKVPRELAQKYQTSIITAHSHHCAQGVALDGKNLIIDCGGLFDKSKTEYIQKTSSHHEWVQGFLMVKDNIPTLYSPVFGNL